MLDDVIVNKAAVIERCLARVNEEYAADPLGWRQNLTRQDSIILNLQRACEAAIDLAMHLVRVRRLGVPQETRQAFQLLTSAGLLPDELGQRLQRMVGFRNVAVHDYQKLHLDIVQAIVEQRLDDFRAFTRAALALAG